MKRVRKKRAVAKRAPRRSALFVTALARGIDVIRAYRIGDPALSNEELARRTGLPRPTITRLTHTLNEIGCLSYEEHTGKWRLGGGIIAAGRIAAANFNPMQVARPLMQQLADSSGFNVGLAAKEDQKIVFLETCHSPALVSLQLSVGLKLPITGSAVGRCYLWTQPKTERDRLIEQLGPEDPSERKNMLHGIDRSFKELDRKGFCVSIGEWHPHVHSAAVALKFEDGIYILASGAPAYLLSREHLVGELGPRLVETARQIASAIGADLALNGDTMRGSQLHKSRRGIASVAEAASES